MRRFGSLIAMMIAMVASVAVWQFSGDAGDRPPMPQSAYVWQRVWTPAVTAGVTNRPAGLSKLIVLVAQVDWDGATPRVTRVQPDYDALQHAGVGVGLALRVTGRRTPIRSGEPAIDQVAELARTLVAGARQAGLQPVEFQVDYDSAENRLGEYRAWIGVVRRAVAPVPLTITVLPCWLGHRDVGALVRETDGFVLQVHSLAITGTSDLPGRLSLVDRQTAVVAVRRAAALGVPFEVALPTYGYVAAFDPEGRPLGLNAEGPLPNWPPTTVLRDVRADPSVMAMLVHAWMAWRPGPMRGVIWYRLPIPGDQHNWASETLDCVMQGQAPEPALTARLLMTDAGRLADVELANHGRADALLDGVQVAIGVDPTCIEAQDGTGGFIARKMGNGVVLVAAAAAIPSRLRPSEKRIVGWVRLRETGPVTVAVEAR